MRCSSALRTRPFDRWDLRFDLAVVHAFVVVGGAWSSSSSDESATSLLSDF